MRKNHWSRPIWHRPSHPQSPEWKNWLSWEIFWWYRHFLSRNQPLGHVRQTEIDKCIIPPDPNQLYLSLTSDRSIYLGLFVLARTPCPSNPERLPEIWMSSVRLCWPTRSPPLPRPPPSPSLPTPFAHRRVVDRRPARSDRRRSAKLCRRKTKPAKYSTAIIFFESFFLYFVVLRRYNYAEFTTQKWMFIIEINNIVLFFIAKHTNLLMFFTLFDLIRLLS